VCARAFKGFNFIIYTIILYKYNISMNFILNQEQINNFFNEAGQGESAQDITLVQPTDLASEDNGGDITMGDIGNDINTVMETAHMGLAGSKLVGSIIAKRSAGMTEDAVNPFYGTIAKSIARRILIQNFHGGSRESQMYAMANNFSKKNGLVELGTSSRRTASLLKNLGYGKTAREAAKNIADKAISQIANKISNVVGPAGTALGLGMTGATWKQSDKIQRGGGVLSGIMSIGGIIAAPFTAGTSLALNVGAAVVGVGTGFA